MRVIGRLIRSSLPLAIFSLFVGSAVLTQPAMADRPGTPNKAQLHWCPHNLTWKPRICGKFHNTATEEVRIEMEFTKNGQPTPLPPMSCGIHTPPNTNCWTGSRAALGKSFDRKIPLVFDVRELDFGAEYCARFRARRNSDDMVSKIWSGWTCAKTPPKPSGPPKTPQFKAEFVKTSLVSGKPEQDYLAVSYTDFELYSDLTLRVFQATGPDQHSGKEYWEQARLAQNNMKRDLFPITLDRTWLYVEVCARNYVARSCSHKVVSADAKTALDPPKPGEKPVRQTGRPRDTTMQVDTNLPGMDYRSQPIGNDPQLCRQMCDNEEACKAWTWVKPAVQSGQAMCWLKKGVPSSTYDRYTVSGVKPGAKPAPAPVLYGVDLPGKDYRQVPIPLWGDCGKLCDQEAQCKAWTWVSRGVQGPAAMCSLKNDVPERVKHPKAASGIKGAGPN